MVLFTIILMFWLLPVQSESQMSQLGWGIIGFIIAGLVVCWICIVIKKTMFILCERNVKLNTEEVKGDKVSGKGKKNDSAKQKQSEEKEYDDIDEDKLDEEEFRQLGRKQQALETVSPKKSVREAYKSGESGAETSMKK